MNQKTNFGDLANKAATNKSLWQAACASLKCVVLNLLKKIRLRIMETRGTMNRYRKNL
jgi:hypothetical protein